MRAIALLITRRPRPATSHDPEHDWATNPPHPAKETQVRAKDRGEAQAARPARGRDAPIEPASVRG